MEGAQHIPGRAISAHEEQRIHARRSECGNCLCGVVRRAPPRVRRAETRRRETRGAQDIIAHGAAPAEPADFVAPRAQC